MTRFHRTSSIVMICFLLTSCRQINQPVGPEPNSEDGTRQSHQNIPTPVKPTFTNTPEPTLTRTPTNTPLPTATSTPTPFPTYTSTPTPSPIPTYVTLRGEVIVEHANCRYGPGEPYLYKYGLVGGSNLEIIARTEPGTWIEIQAIGGNNPCWVKADLMKIKGDVMTVAPVDPEKWKLPMSPYYLTTLRGVSAKRNGNEVTISWSPFTLRPGDDSEQYPYLVETWVCQAGKLVFVPMGTYDTAVSIADEPGCSEPSHGRAYAVEKHGYTRWVEVPWPEVDS